MSRVPLLYFSRGQLEPPDWPDPVGDWASPSIGDVKSEPIMSSAVAMALRRHVPASNVAGAPRHSEAATTFMRRILGNFMLVEWIALILIREHLSAYRTLGQ
jgi:hypothetical protein